MQDLAVSGGASGQSIYTPTTTVAWYWTALAVNIVAFIGINVRRWRFNSVKTSTPDDDIRLKRGSVMSGAHAALLFVAALIFLVYSSFAFYGADTTDPDTGYGYWIAAGFINFFVLCLVLFRPTSDGGSLNFGPASRPQQQQQMSIVTSLLMLADGSVFVIAPFVGICIMLPVLFYLGPSAGVAIGVPGLVLYAIFAIALAVYMYMSSGTKFSGWVIATGIIFEIYVAVLVLLVILSPVISSVITFSGIGIAYLVMTAFILVFIGIADFVWEMMFINLLTSKVASDRRGRPFGMGNL